MAEERRNTGGINDPSATAAASAGGAGAAGDATPTPGQAPRWLGKRVGRYKLVSLLGKGAYGRVFQADDPELHRRVALKIITADATARTVKAGAADVDENLDTGGSGSQAVRHAVERMIREARAAARIEHPGVVHIYDIGTLEGAGLGGYIAMELLDGGTLQDLVDVGGPMDVARACTLIADAAEALHHAHTLGVVHRDVKPANLMLSRLGRCKVADFGLAFIDDPGDGHHYAAAAGTALYLPPEVILGHMADAKSDQYSLAASLFTLLAGRPPYVGDRRRVLEAHVKSLPPDLSAVRPDVDPRLNEVVGRAMAKDPAGRYPSIRHFGKALRLFTIALGSDEAPVGSSSFMAANARALERGMTDTSASGTISGSMSRADLAAVAAAANGSRAVRGRLARSGTPEAEAQKRRRLMVPLAAVVVVAVAILGIAGFLVWSRSDEPGATGKSTAAVTDTRGKSEAASDQPAPGGAGDGETETAGGRFPGGQPPEFGGDAPIGRGEPQRESKSPPPAGAAETGRSRAGEATGDSNDDAAESRGSPAVETNVVPATDFDRLMTIARGDDPAHGDRQATVGGTVSYARASATGKVFRIRFEGTDRDGRSLVVAYFPSAGLFERMQEKFGGEHGSGLLGKTIRVTGRLNVYQDEPQIVVESPDQIEIVTDQAPPQH